MSTQAQPRYTLEDVADLLSDVRSFPSKRDAVQHIAEHYPHLQESWIRDRWDYFQQMDAEGLVCIIGYPDPVGEQAVRNVLREATP